MQIDIVSRSPSLITYFVSIFFEFNYAFICAGHIKLVNFIFFYYYREFKVLPLLWLTILKFSIKILIKA